VRRPLARAVWLSAMLLAGPGAARGAGGGNDYDLENRDWNGLSDLASIAQSRGFTVDTRGDVEWTEIGAGDALFVLYPTGRLDAVHLAAFIRQGGRVLVADDFGRSDEALARLGILRRPALGIHPARVWAGNPNLPVAVPVAEGHPLARGVAELVTNHPAVFSLSGWADTVFAYGNGEAVVVAGQMGTGRFVALSDPSVLINGMLAFDGNLAFAVNLLDFLGGGAPAATAGRPPRIIVLTRDFNLLGQPPDALDEARAAASVNDMLGNLRNGLDELNDYLAPDTILRLIGWLAAVLVLAVGMLVIPLRRPREPDGSFARAAGEITSFEKVVADYDDGRGDRNFALPAAVLRENSEQLDLPDRTLRRLRRLPTRAEILASGAFVSRREFVEVHDLVRQGRSTLGRPNQR
jgi:uncharacterized protein DUF4350